MGKRKTMVLVHGRGQQGKDPAVLSEMWLDSLRQGLGPAREGVLSDVDVVFPFYGDILDQHVTGLAENIWESLAARKRPEVDPAFIEFQLLFLEEAQRSVRVTDEQVSQYLGPQERLRGPFAWEWVQAILRALDDIPGVDRAALELFTYDAFIYLTRPAAREAVNHEIGRHIPAEGAVIIAHSLGSIAAYDLLRRDDGPSSVDLFLTLGSPLGCPAVRRALSPIAYPRGVGAWVNAFDERDSVALYPLDNLNFGVMPPITNLTDVRNGTANNHGIEGYLNDAAVALRIYEALSV